MKAIWTAEDIKPGRRYTRNGIQEVWMIGYRPDLGVKKYVSASLEDGMVTLPLTKRELADHLTKCDYIPIEIAEPK